MSARGGHAKYDAGLSIHPGEGGWYEGLARPWRERGPSEHEGRAIEGVRMASEAIVRASVRVWESRRGGGKGLQRGEEGLRGLRRASVGWGGPQ